MLEYIREKMQGIFATVIVGFFCAVFALWGVESLFNSSGSGKAVATVNGDDITEPELANAIQVMRQRYMQMLGGQVDASFLNDKMLRQPALESLISRKLLDEKTQELGMTVGAKTVEREIVRDPTFSRDGKMFDPEYYKERLRAAQLSAAAYQAQLQQQLVLGHLQQGIAETAFITERQIADMARLESQKRSFNYLLFPLQDAMKTITPSEEAVAKYYQDHAGEFLTEEKVSIEYLELDKNALLKDVQVDEADVRAGYDQEVAAFKPVAERRAAHILVEPKDDGSDRKILETISQRLKAGDSFESLAKKYSRDEGSAAQGGDVGFTAGETFVPEFEAALAALQKPGDVSEPVKTEFGYHIIKLLEARQTALPSYEERKPELEKQLRLAKVGTIYSEKLDQLSEATYSAGDLIGPAAELGLAVQKSDAFGRRGGQGLVGQQKIIDAAFSSELLDSGKNSQVIELSGDKSVVLRVANHELPKARELSEVRADIVARLQREQAIVAIKEKVAPLKARLESGVALKSIAEEQKLQVVSMAAATRNAAKKDQEVVKVAFNLPHPAANAVVADVVQLANGDWVLLQLTAVDNVQPASDSEEYKRVQQRLLADAGKNDFALYEQALRDSGDITRRNASADQESAQ